ncbi:Transformation/transcription domain-associated protein [Trichinella spiralis]|uniref:Transformation/transcription domain-associated protein n=1 Tax=Trichinella spiralis TaxID=6334 RepID=A0ABR3KTX3_TRISP
MENPAISDSIKSTFIQTVIVPGMAEAMERGRVSQFIGPLPEVQNQLYKTIWWSHLWKSFSCRTLKIFICEY